MALRPTRFGMRRDPPGLLERAAYGLGWAIDFALIKPRALHSRLRLDWMFLRNAYNDGFRKAKPGQFGYVGAASAEYARERAEAQSQGRQVA